MMHEHMKGHTQPNTGGKKVYTLEENVKSITFAIKDITKVLEEIRSLLQQNGGI